LIVEHKNPNFVQVSVMCNDFIKLVRNSTKKKKNSILLPNQEGFNPDDWSYFFNTNRSRTEIDENLFYAGLWFHQHAKSIREEKNRVFDQLSSMEIGENLLRLQVGMVNFKLNEIENKAFNSLSGQFLITESFGLTRVIEKFITVARYPISELLEYSSENSNQLNYNYDISCNLPDLLASSIDLGLSYDTLEDIWNECLWNNHYINHSNEYDLVAPLDLDREEIYEVNFQRWITIFQASPTQEWYSLSKSERHRILSQPALSATIKNGEEISLEIRHKVIDSDKSQPFLADAAFNIFRKQDVYPDTLFNKALPNFNGVTLAEILLIWRFFTTFARDIKRNFPKIEDKLDKDNLLCFSPIFSISELIDLTVKTYPKFTKEQVLNVIDLMTFKKRKHDLWSRPLIKVDHDHYTAIFSALDIPNLSHVVADWMRLGDLTIDEKGPEFEKISYNKLCSSNKLSNARVFPSMKFKSCGKQEQIDLIIKLGKVIILSELKCTLFPHDPYQIHRYYEELNGAAKQIKRKTKHVMDNLNVFLNKLELTSLCDKDVRVIPTIISNLPLATGYKIQEVPIIDIKILQDYLGEGKFTLFSRTGNPGAEFEYQPLEQIQVYSSEEEAEEFVENCLNNLPHIREFRKYIHKKTVPIYLGNQDKPIAFRLHMDVTRPQLE
jgi:hypothetical protein